MTRRHRRAFTVLLSFTIGVYGVVWSFRGWLGLISPTANLRYFYYGKAPCTFSDSTLYWLFWPAYKTSLGIQALRGDESEVHWSNRDGGNGYEHLCRAGRRFGV